MATCGDFFYEFVVKMRRLNKHILHEYFNMMYFYVVNGKASGQSWCTMGSVTTNYMGNGEHKDLQMINNLR